MATKHQLLGELLARLDGRSRLRMTEYLQAGRPETIDDPCRQGSLRTDNRKVNPLCLRELQQPVHIRILQRHTFRLLRDARITGGTIDLAHPGRPAQHIDDGVLPPAATDDQYGSHRT